MAISPSVRINVTGARGESQADILRRTGQYGVLPTDSDDAAMAKLNADARQAAAFAEEFSGPAYDTIGDGEAATATGHFFRVPVPNTDPVEYTRYQRTSGGSIEAAPLATTAALASPTGSSLVGFIQSGAGAATRSLQDRLRDTIHARDYGVVANDGVTDETVQFKAAITAAITLKKRLLFDGAVVVSDSLLDGSYTDCLAVQGSGQKATRIINKCVGTSLFNIGNTYYTHLSDFSIEGNHVTGALGNGHAIEMVDPDPGVGAWLPGATKIERVRVTGHRGVGKTYTGGDMPACAIYMVEALGAEIDGSIFQENEIAIYGLRAQQPKVRYCSFEQMHYAAVLWDKCEAPEVLHPVVVGENTQDSGGLIRVETNGTQSGSGGTTVVAGAMTEWACTGSVYIGGKYKNHQHAGLSLNSASHPLVTGAWIRQDYDGCCGIHLGMGARIEGNEFAYSGGAFVGARTAVSINLRSGVNEFGSISRNKITLSGNGEFHVPIDLVASHLYRVSGVIEGNMCGGDTVSGTSTLTSFIRVVGRVRNLVVRNNFMSAKGPLTVALVYDFSGINNQADHGLVEDNNGAWDNFATATITAVRAGPGVGGYTGLQSDGKYNVNALAVNGVQVVGAQGAAVPDATDAPSAITQLNTLLARLRATGIIAT